MSDNKNVRENSNVKIENSGNTRTIKISLMGIIVVFLVLIVGIGYALFTATKKESANAKIGTINVKLEEDWPDPGTTTETGETYDEYGIKKYTKKVWGKSIGDVDAYVRIRCIPIVEYHEQTDGGNGRWITAPVDQDSITINVTAKDSNENQTWVKDGEYWYYTKILHPNENTDNMVIDWSIDQIPAELEGKSVRANVKVILEYAQTTHELWKENFQIDKLPESVEKAK